MGTNRQWKCVGNENKDHYFTLGKIYNENEFGNLIDDDGDSRPAAKKMNRLDWYPDFELVEENKISPHYKKGEDTFAWAEENFSKKQLEAIALFNIHKYTNREKGQNETDRKKAADYLDWMFKVKGK